MKKKYTYEEIQEVAKMFTKRRDFQIQKKGFYLSALRQGFLNKVCAHMKPVQRWDKNKTVEVAKKCKNRQEFREKYSGAYGYAHNKGFLHDLFLTMKNLDTLRVQWTRESALLEAKQYSSLNQFKRGSSGAYKFCFKNNMQKEVHACFSKIKKHKWTDEEVIDAAKQYNTRREFETKELGKYKAVLKRKLQDVAFLHMKFSALSSIPEKDLLSCIKGRFPSALTLRKRGVFIESKPWIYGFDVDVFVPELNKGIEFDGAYWHSFDMLRKTKPNWPVEDIKNYHKIKDEYFAAQGIKILHVKENDWKKNKQKCIQRCFKFLGLKI